MADYLPKAVMASSTCKCKEQTLTAQGPQAEAQGLGWDTVPKAAGNGHAAKSTVLGHTGPTGLLYARTNRACFVHVSGRFARGI